MKKKVTTLLICALLLNLCIPVYASSTSTTNTTVHVAGTPDRSSESFLDSLRNTYNNLVNYVKSFGKQEVVDDSVEFETPTITTPVTTENTSNTSNTSQNSETDSKSVTLKDGGTTASFFQVKSSQSGSKFIFGEDVAQFDKDPKLSDDWSASGSGAALQGTPYEEQCDPYHTPNSFTIADGGAVGVYTPLKSGYSMPNDNTKVSNQKINSVLVYTCNPDSNASCYLITKDANGGVFIDGHGNEYTTAYSDSVHMTGYYGEQPFRDNYTFMGWSTDKNKTATSKIAPITSYSSDTTVYAIWKANTQYSTVTFDVNRSGAKFSDNTTTYQTQVVKGAAPTPPSNPTCDGFTFKGWATSKTATTPMSLSTLDTTSDVTVYGVWEVNGAGQPAVVTLHTMGGYVNGSIADIQYTTTVGTPFSVIPYTPTKEQWKFIGWNTVSTASDALPSTTPITSNMELYAIYESTANQPITVTFHANGGVFVQTGKETVSTNKGSGGTYVYGSKLTSVPSPVKTGYSLLGWSTDPTATEGYDIVNTVLTGDVTYYAVWKNSAQKECTVTFIAGDGTNGSKFSDGTYSLIQTVTTGGMATVPEIPSETMYLTFNYWSKTKAANWYIDTNTKSQPEQYIFSNPVLDDITLYAIYKRQDNSSKFKKVTFDYNGGKYKGKTSLSVNVIIGTPVKKPDTPKREGYTFKTWAVTKDGKEEDVWNFDDPITDDTTLYAIWKGSGSSSSSSSSSNPSSSASTSSSMNPTSAELELLKQQLANQQKALGISSDGTYLTAAQRGLTADDIVEVYEDGSYLASDGNVYDANGNYLHAGKVPKTGINDNPVFMLILLILLIVGSVIIYNVRLRDENTKKVD